MTKRRTPTPEELTLERAIRKFKRAETITKEEEQALNGLPFAQLVNLRPYYFTAQKIRNQERGIIDDSFQGSEEND